MTNFWKHFVGALLLFGLGAGAHAASFEDKPPLVFRTFAGAFFNSSLHNYYVDTELTLPLARYDGLSVDYHYRESTPFLDLIGPQAEVLFARFEVEASLKLSPSVRLIALTGHHQSTTEDRHGFVGAEVVGLGLASRPGTVGDWLEWRAVAGAFVDRDGLNADWWTDLHASWRLWNFPTQDTPDRPQTYTEQSSSGP